MSNTTGISYSERVIEIGSPQQKIGFGSLFLSLLISIVLVSAAAFGVGFLVGQIEINQPQVETLSGGTKITDQKDGNSLFSDSTDKFKVTFPSSWKVTAKEKGVKGVLFESSEASVELWLVVEQPLSLSDEQKAGLASTKQIDMTINKQKISATEYAYTGGNFLTIAELPAKDENSKVTFWIKAKAKETYETAKKIAQSFIFTN